MNRRTFVKRVLATAAVGAVAPQILAEQPPLGYAMGVDAGTAFVGASRVVVGGRQYEIMLDACTWEWKWVPVSMTKFFLPENKTT
jgi:hypothetical protein